LVGYTYILEEEMETRIMSAFGKIVLATVLSLSVLYPTHATAPAPHFKTEQEAKQHCPNDTVVWVNTKTGIYHFKGERWYVVTKQGAYECRREADAEGDRATKNGQ